MAVIDERLVDPTDPETFRAAVHAWLDEHAPAKGSPGDFSAAHLSAPRSAAAFRDHERAVFDRALDWQRQLYGAGLAGLSWPEAYGGRGRPRWCDEVVADEQTHYGVSTKVLSIGLQMASSVLFRHGTDAQRDAHLSRIVRGEEVWCQLFSEPGAGSDLPNIGTRAVAVADGWSITGQKVWTSGATASDFGLALARTDPDSSGRRGLSAFIVDMRSPGIEVRPLREMSGGYHFSEVFLDDVPVGTDTLVGELGGGWDVARTMLASERSSIGGGTSARAAGALVDTAVRLDRAGEPEVRQRLAMAHTRELVMDLLLRRAAEGAPIPAVGSLVKLIYSEHARRTADDAFELLGPAAIAQADEDPLAGPWVDRFLFAPGLRIGGGTDEIQRNQIAERGLGLPREPAARGG